MKLIELYLDEIRHQLPPTNREDIVKEIRSLLMDMIEDRNPNPGESPDEETVKDVLHEFGSPQKVARQYGAHNHLIGPRIYPTYMQVLKIVLIVVAALNVLGLVAAVIAQSGIDPNIFEAILEIVGGLFSSLFTAFGIVTLSFAIIERTTTEDWRAESEQEWKPVDLYKKEDQERVKVPGLAIEITMTLVFIALINFFLDRIGIYYLSGSTWVSAPILNENFLRYIPWITAYAVLDILLNLYLIRKGYWDKPASAAKILINGFKIAVNLAIITGPAVITITSSAWQTLNFGLDFSAQELSRTLNLSLDVLLGLASFGLAVESIKRLYETFIKDSRAAIKIDVN